MEEDHQEGGEQRGQEVPQIRERGRRHGADDHIPEQPSAQRGDLGEHGDAEHVEVLADGQQGAGDREDEDADDIQRVLDGGTEQLLEHPYILTHPAGCTLQSKENSGLRRSYSAGLPVVKIHFWNRSSSCRPEILSASRMKSPVFALP
ncbi:hypothetical protein SY2F82_63350 [Streptomyces sp. Y2F8-2]|nr:hypothetical protein SY2F82_63350 [Streptomyces sp. Y2F8-2]